MKEQEVEVIEKAVDAYRFQHSDSYELIVEALDLVPVADLRETLLIFSIEVSRRLSWSTTPRE